ncbi:MAG TPA: hypothetical protein VL127_02535 [Bryobacteraceae bacterium]|nr:hypothetical protein [Bryobacteraceae bacterium]
MLTNRVNWSLAQSESGAHGLFRQGLPVPSDVFDGGEGARLHPVDVERATQVIEQSRCPQNPPYRRAADPDGFLARQFLA